MAIPTPFGEGHVNVYLLPRRPVTLIDTGIPGPRSLQSIQRGLAEAGLELADVEQVVLTHIHGDHAGGLSAILAEHDLPVYVHEFARPWMEGGDEEAARMEAFQETFTQRCGAPRMQRRGGMRPPPAARVRYVRDGDRLEAGGRVWEVVHVPGHSRVDICLWDRETGEAVVGDHLLPEISSNAFVEPPLPDETERPRPLILYRASMARTRALPWTTLYPGHGTPFANHRALVDRRLEEHDERCEQILGVLEGGATTVWEVSRALFPWLEGPQVFLGLSEVQGHLDLLEERGQVRVEPGDVWRYRPARA
ncbi:MAG: MBL fold metallo-hydrolase [Alicyclobacillus sp.]|nr:MBL fold metallo-hydrolase [Alicyclobacillus sp.]